MFRSRGGFVLSMMFLVWMPAACTPPPPESLVLISLDTVRPDHLPVYGYERDTAPQLSAFASRSVVFENAFAQDVNTGPSHASMFTGLYPHEHGATYNGRPLGDEPPVLPEILSEAGFATAAFVSGYTMRRKPSGLDRGFAVYDDELEGRRDGWKTTDRALAWLAARSEEERFFLFLHLYDAHGPYHAPARYRALFRSPAPGPRLERVPVYQQYGFPPGRAPRHLNPYVDRYDAAIRYMDDRVAQVLRRLDLERTVVVVLSDHGETLGERHYALDHGGQLFDEQIRIPLILFALGLAPARVPDPVETVDLLPTLLELLGISPSRELTVSGRSWLPLLDGDSRPDRRVFSAARSEPDRHADRGYSLDPDRRLHVVRSARWKLIRYPGVEEDLFELYHLESDPGERTNRAALDPEVRDAYRDELRAWRGDAGAAGRPDLAPDVRERLRELGYISD